MVEGIIESKWSFWVLLRSRAGSSLWLGKLRALSLAFHKFVDAGGSGTVGSPTFPFLPRQWAAQQGSCIPWETPSSLQPGPSQVPGLSSSSSSLGLQQGLGGLFKGLVLCVEHRK